MVPDSKRLLVCGSEKAQAPRCYEQDLEGSSPKPVTASGVLGTLAPDGTTLLLTLPGGQFARSSTDGATPVPIISLHGEDRPVGWSADSRAVFVQRSLDAPAFVERVDLTTGQRTTVRQLTADGISSITQINIKAWLNDGRWYVYNYTTLPSTLFVVSGAGRP